MTPEPPNALLNVIDVEATCWEGPPPAGQASEIIEIGVCVLDLRTLKRVDRRSLIVRPERSQVSAFCTALTSLTPEVVVAGLSFAEACGVLRRDYRSDSRPWASWGEYDHRQFQRQAGQAPYPFGARHTNAKTVYAAAFGLPRPDMAHAGLPLLGTHHRSGDDAWNIAAVIAHLGRNRHWPAASAALPGGL